MLRRILGLLVPVALLFGACSGGDDENPLSDLEQDYADAFAKDLADEDDGFGVSPSQGDCIGEEIMRILGAEVFDEAGVQPADLGGSESPGELLGEGTVTEAQAAEITRAWNECVDLVHEFAVRSGDRFDLDAEGLSCYEDALAEGDVLDEYLEVLFRKADPQAGYTVLQRILGLVQGCTTSAEGKGGVLVESIAASLSANGTLNLVNARCVAQELVDLLGVDRLIVLTGNGDLSTVPPEAQEEFAQAIVTATDTCGVPLSQVGG
jgi:hypothetical protein